METRIDDLDPKVPVDGDLGVLDDSQDEVLGVKQSKKFDFSTIVKKSDVVNDDTTGGSDVPSSADVAVTHGTEIDANTANIATNTGDILALQTAVLFSGVLIPWPSSSIPSGWLDCDGSAISRTTYSNLFAQIGTTWGIGDGSTTFNLPDLQGAYLRGVGTSTIFTQDQTITLAQILDDQMQQITGEVSTNNSLFIAFGASPTNNGALSSNTSATSNAPPAGTSGKIDNILFDSANSPNARVGNETRPNSVGIHYIIKY